jgi:glycosyltransferase involved in cell wall biosynthesis
VIGAAKTASRSADAVPPPLPRDVPILMYLDAAEMGGAAVHSVDLASGFRKRGYRVVVLCHRADELAPMREELMRYGVEVVIAEDWDLSPLGRIRRVLTLVSVIRRHRGCLLALMIGNYRSGGPVTLAGVLGGTCSIVRADMQPPMPPVLWRHRLSINIKDLFIDRVVVNAAQNRDAFGRDMGRQRAKIEVVHQGVDLGKFQPDEGRDRARAELGYRPDTIVVGAISRLGGDVWRKGIDQFLVAAGAVATKAPEARFLVVGDGGAKPALQRQARTLGLDRRVDWLGWRPDIPLLLAAMDVFVMPSLHEGTPTILLEAMAMGKPVVASRVGAVAEVVRDGDNGLVVEPNDPHRLAEAMSLLIGRPELRAQLGAHARETALREFSRDLMVDGYLSVFGRVYASRNPGFRGQRQTA